MVGTTISHYEILEKLGEGGMGAVYKARDLTLGRFVAIKVLIAGTEESAERRARFIQEARAASSLNHPNIITIHDIISGGSTNSTKESSGNQGPGEHGDSIVMEFVRGQTLDSLIATGRLPIADCLKIATQTADALAAAHSIGIVHRDLKPANVMVTPEGLTKVLDFGLAKLAVDGTGAIAFGDGDRTMSIQSSSMATTARPRTAEGAIVGTIAYMSPEQAEGRRVDARSDIFSFGAVLYEMLAGERAFRGASGLAVLAGVLRDTPRALSEVRPEVPMAVQDVVSKCLEKDPERRYQSIVETRNDLERIYFSLRAGSGLSATLTIAVPAAAVPVTPSIAVLPFLNLSSDKENEYFSDGLAEEIINALTKLDNLRVAARTSAFAFKGTQKDIRQIGETLHVASVLEGSVRKAGNRVRISVQLIDAGQGNNLWSERYDREMTDVFEIQDEISQNIVGKLRVKLASQSGSGVTPAPAVPLVKRYTENLEAYNLYLKGRYEQYKMTRQGLDAGKRLFQEAIKLDPEYALAYAELGYNLYLDIALGFAAPNEAAPRAKAAVAKALALDETVAEAHATLGVILTIHEWNWAGAEREFLRSIELNGASPVSRDVYAFYHLRPQNRLEEARAQTEQALALDPLSIFFRVHLGFLYYVERNYDKAVAQFRKALEMSPDYYLANALMGMALTFLNEFDAALACYERARKAEMQSMFVASLNAMTLGFAGRREQALALLEEIRRSAGKEYSSPTGIAYVWTSLGDKDRAFASLNQALEERDPNVLGLKTNPIFDSLRGDARYPALLEKMGFR
jgi:serine/threonine-protein kinase